MKNVLFLIVLALILLVASGTALSAKRQTKLTSKDFVFLHPGDDKVITSMYSNERICIKTFCPNCPKVICFVADALGWAYFNSYIKNCCAWEFVDLPQDIVDPAPFEETQAINPSRAK